MVELGNAEGEAAPHLGHLRQPLGLLLIGPVFSHELQAQAVADDGVLGLQVAVQAQPLRGQVLADDGHAQIAALLAAVLLRPRVPVEAGGVGPAPGFGHQQLPLVVGKPAAIPVGPGVFPAVVQEANVVVFLLEWFDLRLDEGVDLLEEFPDVLGDFEVHCVHLS